LERLSGKNTTGICTVSLYVLNEETTIQKNGTSVMSAMNKRTKNPAVIS
jgi:hypothetical protein